MLATGLIVAGGLSVLSYTPPDARDARADIVASAVASLTPAAHAADAAHATSNGSPDGRTLETLGQRPLGFEQNRGQFDAATRFAARGAGYGIFLTDSDAVLALRRGDNGGTATLRMSVVNGEPTPDHAQLVGIEPLPGAIHHYAGQGASQTAITTAAYARVQRTNVYEGIDLVFYGNQKRLEYDFVVFPGRDPNVIRVQFTGASRMAIDTASGDLLLHVDGGEPVRQHAPVTYQVIDGARRDVASRYALAGSNQVRFEIGAYDRTQPLVIDPVLSYSTYFGSLSEELIGDIAIDPAGNIYVAGRTEDDPQFPTHNAFQPTKPGKRDGFVSKFNPAGTALIYSTFVGGAEDENATEHFVRLAVDAAGNAYIAGSTLSANYPVTANGDDQVFNGDVLTGNMDSYYTKLTPEGALAYSTFIGGIRTDFATGIAVDPAGNVYVSGFTVSSEGESFPVTANAYDQTYNGNGDLFLVKFDAAGTRTYATYLGGNSPEQTAAAYGGLAIDGNGRAYLVTDSWSPNYPVVNGAQAAFGGQYDAVLSAIDTTVAGAVGLVYSTYFGGPNKENAYSVAYAGNGQVVVVGEAVAGLPVKNAVQPAFGGIFDGYLAKFDTTQSGAASLVWSTYFGGGDRDKILDVAVDQTGAVHVVGDTRSNDFPLVLPYRNIRWQDQMFAAKFLPANGPGSVVYSTFLGSNTNKQSLQAVAVNALGEAYFGGYTWHDDTDPPVADGFLLRNPYQAIYGGGDGDGWILKIGFDADVQITMQAAPEPVPPGFNITYTIHVRNNSTDPAGNVVVTNTLPGVVTFVSCDATGGGACGGTGNTRTIGFGTMAGNAQATITIVATVNGGTAPGAAFTNTATIATTSADAVPENNTANAVSHTPTLDPTQDADGDGIKNIDEYHQGTHPRGFVITYFAEGSTGPFFRTRIALANPGDRQALVLLRYQTTESEIVRQYVRVAPHSRATIDVHEVAGMEGEAFSTLIEADEPIVADRTMSWDHSGYGSHAERGTLTRTATKWYLAEGATHGNFELFYLIQNAGLTPAEVEVTFLLRAPKAPIVKRYTIQGDTRFTLHVDAIPELVEEEMSAVITSLNAVPIVVERAMYLNTPTQTFGAGTGSAGATDLATRWFLAEGATGSFFDMFILIGNPNPEPADVDVTYMIIGGGTVTKRYTVAGMSRRTISVDSEGDAAGDAAFSTVVTSLNNVPIVVERVMWWPQVGWQEGHNSFGETTTGTRWGMAEGEQGGEQNKSTYYLIANTSPFEGTARVRLFFEDGSTAEKTFGVAANTRFNVDINRDFPEAANRRFGALVESLGATPAQIVVERAVYSDVGGQFWAAGTNAVATRLQ